MNNVYDVGIIGVGVAGAFACYKIAKEYKDLKVVCFDIGRPPFCGIIIVGCKRDVTIPACEVAGGELVGPCATTDSPASTKSLSLFQSIYIL